MGLSTQKPRKMLLKVLKYRAFSFILQSLNLSWWFLTLLFNVTSIRHRDIHDASADPHGSWGSALRREVCAAHSLLD